MEEVAYLRGLVTVRPDQKDGFRAAIKGKIDSRRTVTVSKTGHSAAEALEFLLRAYSEELFEVLAFRLAEEAAAAQAKAEEAKPKRRSRSKT